MFTKGDILLPSIRVAKKDWLNGLYHPAVVWDVQYDGNTDFRGIMITHAGPSKSFTNVLMDASHFETGHEVKFSNSHFVNQIFMKFQNWGPFELVGRLTPVGIKFIENKLTVNVSMMEFTTYRASIFK